jgi:arylsulfatase A-like enzyme
MAGASSDAPDGAPNIVLILADDLGWGDLRCYGATKAVTPNCDRLAMEGIRFTDAHSSSAVCSPSRYSVLTGRYAWRTWLKNGILLEHMPLLIEPGRLTLPSMLKDYGYATACVGKWHLGWGSDINADWNGEVQPGPLEVGFEYFYGIPTSHDSPDRLRVYVEDRRVVGLEPGENLFDNDTLRRVMRDRPDTAKRLTRVAVDFIERNKDGRFFLYFPTSNVHMPWTPAKEFKGISDAGEYGDYVSEFDWSVGEILDALDRLDLADNTLVVVTSDNGARNRPDLTVGHISNGPWRGGKGGVYEAGHRVPFIARWPGRIGAGETSGETICLTDLTATAASIVGYTLEDSQAEDSYDVLPALSGRSAGDPIREATVHHSVTGVFAIRQGRWKLIESQRGGNQEVAGIWDMVKAESMSLPLYDPDTGELIDVWYDFQVPGPDPDAPPGQLFDLEADPAESVNLYGEHPEVVERLQQLLARYRSEGRSRR